MSSILGRDGDTGAQIRLDALPSPDGAVLPVTNSVQKRVRYEFSGAALDPAKWTVGQTGSGMSHALTYGALAVQTGTAVDDELVFTSREAFTVPFRVMAAVGLSQRIAGQSVFLEVVSDDGECAAAWQLSGTSATAGFYEVKAGGPRLTSSAVSTNSTASPTIFEIEPFSDEVWFHFRGMDSAAARGGSHVRHQQIPKPDRLYRVRVRVLNRQRLAGVSAVANNGAGLVRVTRAGHGFATGDTVLVEGVDGVPGANGSFTVAVVDANTFDLNGSAFAGAYVNTGWATVSKSNHALTNTAVTVPFVCVTDYAELTAEITAGRGSGAAGQGIFTNSNVVGGTVGVQGISGDGSGTVPAPVLIGVKAATALPAGAASGRAHSVLATTVGAAVVRPFSIPEADWTWQSGSNIADTTARTMRAAGGAGIRNYVTALQLINTGAAGTDVAVLDGAGAVWRSVLPPNMTAPVSIEFPTPLRSSPATPINFAIFTATASVAANAQGYQAP